MEIIKLLTEQDINRYVDHLVRHLPEPGLNGIISQPYSASETFNKNEMKNKILEKWQGQAGENSWEMVWGLIDGENRIVGHVELNGDSMKAVRHRAKLGMGIEQNYRSKGHGKKLIQTAIQWASSQQFLSWIDLYVFSHNTVAKKLYESFGFQEIGITMDCLRVHDQSIDDVHFALSLKNAHGFPDGFSLKECSPEEFEKIVGGLRKSIFEETEYHVWPEDIISDQEKSKLEQLNTNYKINYNLCLVLFFHGKLAGWTCGFQDSRESFCMGNSAILPEFRGKSLYSKILRAALDILKEKGFQRIWSTHRITNNHVIIPKLKQGFQITGSGINDMSGSFVQLTYYANPVRKKILDYRACQVSPDQELKKIFHF